MCKLLRKCDSGGLSPGSGGEVSLCAEQQWQKGKHTRLSEMHVSLSFSQTQLSLRKRAYCPLIPSSRAPRMSHSTYSSTWMLHISLSLYVSLLFFAFFLSPVGSGISLSALSSAAISSSSCLSVRASHTHNSKARDRRNAARDVIIVRRWR